MQVPISWLKEYVDVTLNPTALAEKITDAGLEVEAIRFIGIDGADLVWDREKVLLAQVTRVEQHPDADRLVLATAEYGGAEPKVVVTGAPNLFQYVGQGDLTPLELFSPIIFEGATYLNPYKDGKPTVLKGRPLRGIYNDAMLCSAVELGLGDDHDGIILIRKDAAWEHYCTTMPLVPGTPLQDFLGDAVLDIAILPNIARCASILGVAREVAAITETTVRPPDYTVVHSGPSATDRIVIETEAPALNPRFSALLIEGVEQGRPTPFWMSHRLALVGQRSLGVLVDISNYVMFEMGQPNHAFDYDFLRRRADTYAPDGPVRIITRLPHASETLQTLDGVTHELPDHAILVTDPAGNLSLGGIMGGYESEIKDDTTSVLLEAAAWNFINIRRTLTALKMHSDAGYRFSRGVHPNQAILGARRAAELMRRVAGGTVAAGEIDMIAQPAEPVTVPLTAAYIRRWTGLDLSLDAIARLLHRLAFTTAVDGDRLLVTVPDHRLDIEGPHDLAEEVCRMIGYENIPTTIISDTLPPQRGNVDLEKEEALKDKLAQTGLQEVITYRLTTAAQEKKLLTPASAPDDRPYITIINPSTQDRVVMRHSLLSSVMEIAAANSRYRDRIGVFEIGHIYLADEGEELPQELRRAALILTGRRTVPAWTASGAVPAGVAPPPAPTLYDFYDLKGIIEEMASHFQLDLTFAPASHPTYRPGRTAHIKLNGKQVGILGELHPLVVEQHAFRIQADQPVLAAELDLEALLPPMKLTFEVVPPPEYPPVLEDLAFVVTEDVAAADVTAVINLAGGYLLRRVELFDVYRGPSIAAGRKSLAYHLTFQAPDKTLKDKDVARLRQRIVKQVSNELGATLRAS